MNTNKHYRIISQESTRSRLALRRFRVAMGWLWLAIGGLWVGVGGLKAENTFPVLQVGTQTYTNVTVTTKAKT